MLLRSISQSSFLSRHSPTIRAEFTEASIRPQRRPNSSKPVPSPAKGLERVHVPRPPARLIDLIAFRTLRRHLIQLFGRLPQRGAHPFHLRRIAARRRPKRRARQAHKRPHHLEPAGAPGVAPVVPRRRPAPDPLHARRPLLERLPPLIRDRIHPLAILAGLHPLVPSHRPLLEQRKQRQAHLARLEEATTPAPRLAIMAGSL